jgi:hypothetical protein
MNEQSPVYGKPSYNSLHKEIEGFDSLAELALDLHWSWNHATDEVWRQLDPRCGSSRKIPGWFCRRSPRTNSKACWPIRPSAKILMTCCNPSVRRRRAPAWFQKNHPQSPLEVRRVFQHGIHVERSAADLLRRSGQCGRRSTQSRQRSWACRWSAWDCSTSKVIFVR